ncbi:DNA (cytosine-5-)-methyltransferase [Aliarcobacter butzleri]|uniref:DNA cytosine methyltransferase n=1 Tax=Aliarcobacter butzleri TaxID=28197 RepID=UPI003F4D9B3D
MLHNHTINKVSELDMKMIVSIPEGGNWKNIPLDIPSKRLEGIRKTGGRTTLYGRINRNKPSYTINTYITRPGNGTFIHPIHDRLITPREAARLQSFPDNYIFYGAKSHVATQIGNAVPPLLAYTVAKEVKHYLSSYNVLDLFSGAGGMGYGFKQAGFNIVLANDVFKEASLTYKRNNPGVNFVEGSITEKEVKEKIIAISEKNSIDIIIGGPPCQGFSLAGKRLSDDPRNFLYKEFVSLVDRLKPKVFVMENVTGILSSNGGKTFESIKSEFSALGYSISAKKLLASDYGVPQKRKRVFIVGTYNVECIFNPKKIILDEKDYISVDDAISDLYNIKAIENKENIIEYKPDKDLTEYQKYLTNKITIEEFINSIKC